MCGDFPRCLRDFLPKWGKEIGSQTKVYYLNLWLLIETCYLFKFTRKQAIQFHPFTTAQDVRSYLLWRYRSLSPLRSDGRNPPHQHHLGAFHPFFFRVTLAPHNPISDPFLQLAPLIPVISRLQRQQPPPAHESREFLPLYREGEKLLYL